jgi:hypothetical protein
MLVHILEMFYLYILDNLRSYFGLVWQKPDAHV